MKRPKLKTALISAFLLLGVTVACFATFSISRLHVINDNVREIATDWMPDLALAQTMALNVSELRATYRDHILADNGAAKAQYEAQITQIQNGLHESLDQYTAMGLTADEVDIIGDIRKSLEDFTRMGKSVLEISRLKSMREATSALYIGLGPVGDRITAAAEKLVAIKKEGAAASYQASEHAFALALKLSLAAVAFTLIAVIAAVWFAIFGVARPIERITASMETLSQGDTALEIPFSGRSDEIGQMAKAVSVFKSNINANRDLEVAAAASRNAAAEESQRNAEIEKIRAAEMSQATEGLANALRYLADGNLEFRLTNSFAPDFESLRQDFNAAAGRLSDALVEVMSAATTIDGGSREISASADDLSKRTEQQASSLEETAAALDEITVNVANSSKRADEASKIALLANESASRSGVIVADAVDAMKKIEQSSNQVSNIIGVIDEIAFQTNLLALNAGVEAARAGEAGKGFAVVAQEVRELAQRSAHAAKEIKDLIRNSSAEVGSGVRLVSQTGEALRTIGDYIATVSHHMDSIATSAREQSVGLSEVNTAVNQMDQVTQQNAAMVEQANAAGLALAGESAKLKQLVERFRVSGPSAKPSIISGHASLSPARDLAARVKRSFGSAAEQSWEEF